MTKEAVTVFSGRKETMKVYNFSPEEYHYRLSMDTGPLSDTHTQRRAKAGLWLYRSEVFWDGWVEKRHSDR